MNPESSLQSDQYFDIQSSDLIVLGAVILLWGGGWPVAHKIVGALRSL